MHDSIAPAPLKHPDRFFIDGEWVAPSSGAKIEVISPSTEQVYLEVAEAQAADVENAVAAARRAFDHGPWPCMTHAQRADMLRRIARKIEARAEDFARVQANQIGAVLSFARQCLGITAQIDRFADMAADFPFEERHHPEGGGAVGLLVREPVGVVACVIPWNGPLMLIVVKCMPALLAGCTIILKASPEAPGEAYLMAEIIEELGLPPGVFNVLTADREVSERLISHPEVDKVSFTGSTAAGRRIASICGDRIARYTLELGGKSPALVLDDYDLGIAAGSIAGNIRALSGQGCSLLTRVIAPRPSHDAMVEALAHEFGRIRVGDPFDAATEMGPLAMRRQRDRVEGYIAKGKAEGATVAIGGGRPAHLNRGFYVEPTVFGNVDNRSTIAREEIFGPVVCVIPADDEDHAIAIANDTIFGLNASVFTNDVDRAWRLARRLRSGTVGQNAFRSDFSIAFGGFKQSGIGREGGTEGLMSFLETKTVILDGLPGHVVTA